jgi:hypothetical protein
MGLFKNTVDSIIADISAKIEKLSVVAEAHALAAQLHRDVIDERQKLVNFANQEEARARSIAAKFKALIS